MQARTDGLATVRRACVRKPSRGRRARQRFVRRVAKAASARSCQRDCPTRPIASAVVHSDDPRVAIDKARRPRDGPTHAATVRSHSARPLDNRARDTIAAHDRRHTGYRELAEFVRTARPYSTRHIATRKETYTNTASSLLGATSSALKTALRSSTFTGFDT